MLKRIKRTFGQVVGANEGPPSTSAGESVTRAPSSTSGGTASRKQLLAIVLRETLLRNAVPRDCVGMDFFRTIGRGGERNDGIHVRLILLDMHDELSARMVALERDFRRRLAVIDWRAAEWLQGISWQLDLPPEDEASAAAAQAPTALTAADAAAAALDRRAALSRAFDQRAEDDAEGQTYAFTAPAPL